MKPWSEIEEPLAWCRIELTAQGYLVLVNQADQEEALTTFQSIQMGHAVFFDGSQEDQKVWYDSKSRALCLSGPGNLMAALKNLELGQSYPPKTQPEDSATS